MPRLLICVLLTGIAAAVSGCAPYRVWSKCGSGCPGDAQLTAEVRVRLNAHTELLAPNEVDVRVLDRVAYLGGLVATDVQRDTAESVARSTPGVSRVVDQIALEYNGW